MRRAFSLVELSIVLVILGLLVGGLLAGQSLIKAAELRKITTDRDRYMTAIYSFRDKYFALPGDFNKATDFWTENTSLCSTATANTAAGTCNGDANNFVSHSVSTLRESYWAWQHLAYAGLIEGQYRGARGTSGGVFSIVGGFSAPQSARNTLFYIQQPDYGGCRTGMYATDYSYNGLYVMKAGLVPSGSNYDCATGASLAPQDAYNIDMKTDDGKASTGNFLTKTWYGGTTGTCVNLDTSVTQTYNSADYVLSETTEACISLWRLR